MEILSEPTTAYIAAHTASVVDDNAMALSVIIPVYNEEENVLRIYQRFTEVLGEAPLPYQNAYEIIFVDDGSSDQSYNACADIQRQDQRVVVLQFRRNFGKTAALAAGINVARGKRIVTIDADMQEDPKDTFLLLDRLDEGFDLVSAWRKERNDPRDKTVPSRIFNAIVARLTGVPLHDFNCGFKAYRREVLDTLRLYGELHRFIPVLAVQYGFRVDEVPVEHHPRKFGKSKFGSKRLLNGYLDFVNVLFLTTYMKHPLRLFGTIGTFLIGIGFLMCFYLTIVWFIGNEGIGTRPLLTLGVMLIITGIQFFSTGLVCEILRHNNYNSKTEYILRNVLSARQHVPSQSRQEH